MTENPVQGKNAVLEVLRRNVRIRGIYLDSATGKDEKIAEIVSIASSRRIPLKRVDRATLQGISSFGGRNIPVVALAEPPSLPATLPQLLRQCREAGLNPFLLMLGQVDYRQNLGAIARTANAAGVHGILVPRTRKNPVTPEVIRISMGASLFTPIIRESPYSALKVLKSEALHIVGADMEAAKPYHEADLRGSIAFVLGGEDGRLPEPIIRRCDEMVSIPMYGIASSLNLSVACSVLVYEKLRQEAAGRPLEQVHSGQLAEDHKKPHSRSARMSQWP